MKPLGIASVVCGLFLCGYGGYQVTQQLTLGEPLTQKSTPVQKQSQVPKESQVSKVSSNSVQWVVFKKRPKIGDPIGDLIIPKLNIKLPIVEGTDDAQLEKGVGHYSTSVLPGEPDLAVLAGHRESALRGLGKLSNGDEIIVQMQNYQFTYKMVKSWITSKEDRTVIAHIGKPKLDVITCYPFYYIGPAPNRYIVQADLVKVSLQPRDR